MSSIELSVVMPVHNEAEHLPATVDALVAAVEQSGFESVDVVLVDDGSTDGSAAVFEQVLSQRLPLRVVSQPNRGRLHARLAGLDAATGDWLLFLDGRSRLQPGSLAFVRERLGHDELVWNAHVHIGTDGNPFGVFWDVLVHLAWGEYFSNPRTTSFDDATFDRFPKGTTGFLAPRLLLVEALAAFETRYRDLRFANDDTVFIRWISRRERIHISPRYACEYTARGDLRSFLRHAYHRGTVFLDGHGRSEARLFPAVVAFYPVSAALAVATLRRPSLAPVAGMLCALVATTVARRRGRSQRDAVSFGALAPLYAVAHGAGMWRGLAMAIRDRSLATS
jgi:glycosyltransferase involved in cell wall biosynthesis